MKKFFFAVFIFSILLTSRLVVKAQLLEKVEQAVDFYYQNHFQEKVFIHTDKEQYLAGELLWFKSYIVSSASLVPTRLSKVAYLELLDQNNGIVLQAKIALEKGVGNGSFVIPATIANGMYKLRAYTNWMKNYGPTTFFEKNISIYNLQLSTPISLTNKLNPVIQFFPEGGDLINGISNNVGFKVISSEGKGIDVVGFIINQKKDTVARFKSLKVGIGKFNFVPSINDKYKAILISKSNGVLITDLPETKAQGYAIALIESENELKLELNTNIKEDKAYLFIHNGAKTSFAESRAIESGKAVFLIDKANLIDGMSHLTIFNQNGQAVCERLYFKRAKQKLNIQITSSAVYENRKKINIDLAVSNANNDLVNASLSIAVRKLDSFQEMDEEDIVSYFWLSSELKGNIESPSYYFNTNSEEANQALDNLVLTQGWRRFKWSEILNKDIPQFKFLPEVNGHLINGKITNKAGSAIKYKQVFLSIPGSRIQFYDGESDTIGRFLFNPKDFYGKNEVVIQTDLVDTTSVIEVESSFSDQYSQVEISNFDHKPSLMKELEAYNFYLQVQKTYLSDKLKKITVPIVDSVPFYGKPFKTYNLADYTRFTTMEETLRSYVTEAFVSIKQNKFNIRLLGKYASLDDNPLVLLDGVPYFNIDKAMQIDPNKIAKLEIIPENYQYGSSQYAGILSFISIKNSLANTEINPNAVVLDYEGMQLHREFYSPSYDTPAKNASRIPDFRNVLYWSPSIDTDAKGKAQVNFYSSDIPGIYIGIVNGLSENGIPGSSSFKFHVK